MSRKLKPIEDKSEFARLKKRSGKFLDYALRHKKKNKSLIQSTALFVEGERQRAVEDYQRRHRYRTMSRWDHLKAVFK